MNPPSSQHRLTRREAILAALKGTAVAAAAAPLVAPVVTAAPPAEPDFVPENDYPFFGGELPEGY